MPYVSPDSFLQKLVTLRSDYKERAKTSLNVFDQPLTISCFMGAKDIVTRDQQITFIEVCLRSQHHRLSPALYFAKEEEVREHVLALRLLTAACLFIRVQIRKEYLIRSETKSVLHTLLDEALGLVGEGLDNALDLRTENSCFLEAHQYVNSQNHFLILDYAAFGFFLEEKVKTFKASYTKPYPFTGLLMPFFGNLFRSIGNKTGHLLADSINKTKPLVQNIRYTISATIGSNLFLLIKPTLSSFGVFLLAPNLAEILSDAVITHSLVYFLENIMKILGQGIGFSMGMSLDLSIKLLLQIATILQEVFHWRQQAVKLSGFSLIDGIRIEDGIKLRIENVQDLPPPYEDDPDHYDQIRFEVKPEGLQLQMGIEDGKRQSLIPWDGQLKEHVQQRFDQYQIREYDLVSLPVPSAPIMPIDNAEQYHADCKSEASSLLSL